MQCKRNTKIVLFRTTPSSRPCTSTAFVCIPTTSNASMLWKFTSCNKWWRPCPTTFHPHPLSIHFQTWIGPMHVLCGWVFLPCSVCELNANSMSMQCPVRTHLHKWMINLIVCSYFFLFQVLISVESVRWSPILPWNKIVSGDAKGQSSGVEQSSVSFVSFVLVQFT